MFIISFAVLFLFAFSLESHFVSANELELEINDDLIQEDRELEKEIEELIKNAPNLEPPTEHGAISMFMTSSAYKPRAGDILYTPSTQCKDNTAKCKGLTGHVGIVSITGSHVYHIRGLNAKPNSIPKSTWFGNYKKTMILRPHSQSDGKKAAEWVYNHYIKGPGKNKTYEVTLSRSVNLKTTYCTLIPWQGYVNGANNNLGSSVGYLLPTSLVNQSLLKGFSLHGKVGY